MVEEGVKVVFHQSKSFITRVELCKKFRIKKYDKWDENFSSKFNSWFDIKQRLIRQEVDWDYRV